MSKFSKRTYEQLKAALREDIGRGDITSNTLIPETAKGRAVILAREAGVFCGAEAARYLLKEADPRLKVRFRVKDGQPYRRNQKLVEIQGRVRSILAAERTVLNFLGRLCGIATLTRRFVEKVKPYPVQILDTRKTTPLWRELEKYAVKTGGGRNHRMGLYDAFFVKENHRVHGNVGAYRDTPLRKYKGRFEIEVRNFKELREALRLQPRVILLDNFSPGELKKAVGEIRGRSCPPKIGRIRPLADWGQVRPPEAGPPLAEKDRPLLEASGGITLKNVRRYAATGVEWISVGALTHSASAANLSLLVLSNP